MGGRGWDGGTAMPVKILLTLSIGIPACLLGTAKLTWKLWLLVGPAVWWLRSSGVAQAMYEDGGIRLDTILLGFGMSLTVLTFLGLFGVVAFRTIVQSETVGNSQDS